MKQWANRKAQAEHVVGATLGAYGDMQGGTVKSLRANESLELETQVTAGIKTKALSST